MSLLLFQKLGFPHKATRFYKRIRPAPARFLLLMGSPQGGIIMASIKVFALVLIVAGVLALAYGGFTYTKNTHTTELGPIEMTVKDKEHVNVPVWAGFAAVAAGALMLVVPQRT
jgi:hypothetical protein